MVELLEVHPQQLPHLQQLLLVRRVPRPRSTALVHDRRPFWSLSSLFELNLPTVELLEVRPQQLPHLQQLLLVRRVPRPRPQMFISLSLIPVERILKAK